MCTESFIILCLCIFAVVAWILSVATMGLMIHGRTFETTPLQRFGYVILATILTPILWVIGLALIVEHIFLKMRNETEG